MRESIKIFGDDGEEIDFYILEQTQVGGNTYLLASEREAEDEGSLWIFRQVETGEEEVYYETIEDESELKAIAGVFSEMLEDYDIEL